MSLLQAAQTTAAVASTAQSGFSLARLFGGKKQSREPAEAARAVGVAGQLQTAIEGAQSFEDLYRRMRVYQTGYVGGSSSVAVDVEIQVPRSIAQELGQNDVYLMADGFIRLPYLGLYPPVTGAGRALTMPEFFQAVIAFPERLIIGTQAGVKPGLLAGANQGIHVSLLNKIAELAERDGAAIGLRSQIPQLSSFLDSSVQVPRAAVAGLPGVRAREELDQIETRRNQPIPVIEAGRVISPLAQSVMGGSVSAWAWPVVIGGVILFLVTKIGR